jgi:uncharacterized membrane protein YkvA (DUF1232 family)
METLALSGACRDPRVPWYAKALAGCVVAYALSPIDLIPDFIPVLGYVDDLIVLPIGVRYVVKLIPPDVLADCRERIDAGHRSRPRQAMLVGVAIVLTAWLLAAALLAAVIWAPRVAE